MKKDKRTLPEKSAKIAEKSQDIKCEQSKRNKNNEKYENVESKCKSVCVSCSYTRFTCTCKSVLICAQLLLTLCMHFIRPSSEQNKAAVSFSYFRCLWCSFLLCCRIFVVIVFFSYLFTFLGYNFHERMGMRVCERANGGG